MVNPRGLLGFGEEIENYSKAGLDWLIYVRDPAEVFKAQPTFLISECVFITIGLLCLIHAFVVGGRWKYHWLGCFLFGLVIETVSFWTPDVDNYWHSQSTIMFLGQRLPLHILLTYPAFMYNAAYMVAHAKLPGWAEPLAAGLTQVLIDLPYDIIAVKFVHFTWHDTDPNIYDRHYNVPWTSYYFHLASGTAFTFALNFWRRKVTGTDEKGEVSSPVKEIVCALLAALSAMLGCVLQFISLYHPLHDVYGIHTENCLITIAVVYFLIVWVADRVPELTSRQQKDEKSHWSVIIIVFNMVLHYGIYMSMAVFGKPEEEISIGLHQRTGPCEEKTKVHTAFGGVLERGSYLCVSDYDEKYYDFHCLPGGQPVDDGMDWYTICGTPFANQAEYISVISLICFVAAVVFYNLLFRSSSTLIYKVKVEEKEKRN